MRFALLLLAVGCAEPVTRPTRDASWFLPTVTVDLTDGGSREGLRNGDYAYREMTVDYPSEPGVPYVTLRGPHVTDPSRGALWVYQGCEISGSCADFSFNCSQAGGRVSAVFEVDFWANGSRSSMQTSNFVIECH